MKAKRAKLNLIAVLFLILAVICAAAGVAFAYFSSSSGDETYTIGTEIVSDDDGTSYVVTVSDFSALARVSKSSYYNSSSKVSSSSTYDRKVITLSSDITLENDLWITADAYIDLNGNTLDLNGYTLTIQHSYAGTFTVYDGTIKANEITTTTTDESGTVTTTTTYNGSVVIDAPNASVLFDSVKDVGGTEISYTATNKYVTVLSCVETQNFDYAAYSALYTVGAALSSDLEKRPDRLTYAEFNALSDTTTKYAATNFLSDKVTHTITTGDPTSETITEGTVGTTVTTSIGTPVTATDSTTGITTTTTVTTKTTVAITEKTSTDDEGNSTTTQTKTTTTTTDTKVVTAGCVYVKVGNDLDLPTHYLSTDYTITYTSGNTAYLSDLGNALAAGDTTLIVTVSDGDSSTDDVTVTFPVHVISSATTAVAQTLIESYLSEYYDSADSRYEFLNAIQLPAVDSDLGLTLSYSVDGGDITAVTSSNTRAYLLTPDTSSTTLTVTVDSTSDTFTLSIYSSYVPTHEAIAKLILTKLYGGAIEYNYNSTATNTTLYTVDNYADSELDQVLKDEIADLITNYKVTSITYAIKGDAETYYSLSETTDTTTSTTSYSLTVNSGTTPASKVGSVTCTMKMDDSDVSVDLNVLYVAEGGGVSGFLTYYNDYNAKVESSTSKSFEMPFVTDSMCTVYDFAYDYATITTDTPYYYVSYAYTEVASDATFDETATYYTKSGDTYTAVTITEFESGTTYYTRSVGSSLSFSAPNAISLTLATRMYTQASGSIDDNKTYYSDAVGKTEVENPVADNISSYYVAVYTNIVTLTYSGYTVAGAESETSVSATSLTDVFDAWLASQSTYTLNSLASTENITWVITVDRSKLEYDDVSMLLLYNYRNSTATAWTPYVTTTDDTTKATKYTSSNITAFTLKGGVYFSSTTENNGVVKDATLFEWMRSKYVGKDSAVNFIENSVLEEPMTIDVTSDETDKKLTGVSVWTGIDKLTGLIEANFFEVNMSSVYANLINLQSLQVLTLSSCSLTTLSELFTAGSTYTTFPELKELDVSNNSIEDFTSWLSKDNFPALEEVYVYGNESSNDFEGSEGMKNYQTFEDLTKRSGVTVYNTTNTNSVPVAFADLSDNSDYVRMKTIVYQSIISSSYDITNLYDKYDDMTSSELKAAFNLDYSYSASWSYGGGTTAATATYFQVTLTYGSYSFTVKYYVDRLESTTDTTGSSGDTAEGSGESST